MEAHERTRLNTFEEYIEIVTRSVSQMKEDSIGIEEEFEYNLGVENSDINFPMEFPFSAQVLGLVFAEEIELIYGKNLVISFTNCIFSKEFKLVANVNYKFYFEDCTFVDKLNLSEMKLMKKVRFRHCTFNEVGFRNTVFNDLADFWRCTFTKTTIFYKTDFNATTVFSASEFKENVLFTYSLIGKLIIFRGTQFNKGIDLSLAILAGEIGSFDVRVKDYDVVKIQTNTITRKEYEKIYENYVSTLGLIPLINKRETFRVFKQNLVSQNNISESLNFKVLEKETLRTELKYPDFIPTDEDEVLLGYKKISLYADVYLDRFSLWLNKKSNYYGKSYGRAFVFILSTGGFFCWLSLITTNTYQFTLNPANWELERGLQYFVQFLLPTHRFDYLGEDVQLTSGFYLWDFVGRIFVGYGIYQFIQAFRKYR